METAILTLKCNDKPGIVARISHWITELAGNIVQLNQYSTNASHGTFFTRLKIHFPNNKYSLIDLREQFTPLGEVLNAQWQLHDAAHKQRVGLLVSKYDHCLYELLYRWSSKELNIDIPFIASNHSVCESLALQFSIPFHHLPINNKQEQEQQLLTLATNTDLLVLARYMQILSAQFINTYSKNIINIHHSFLPSFAGAAPYTQAYERGVKIIGATAHYVTQDLDEGPIISQQVEHVSHEAGVPELKRKGKHLEKRVLLDALHAEIEHRIIREQNKTVVFN